MSKPRVFYECGICDCLHPWEWNGDCRDDENRYAPYSGGEPDPHNKEVGKDDIIRPWEDRRIADKMTTPNGYDRHWIVAINGVLEDRESPVRIKDIKEGVWDEYIGPMIEMIEERDLPSSLVEYQ